MRRGRLQPVPADVETARARLAAADQHLATARHLLDEDLDLEIAYVALYDLDDAQDIVGAARERVRRG